MAWLLSNSNHTEYSPFTDFSRDIALLDILALSCRLEKWKGGESGKAMGSPLWSFVLSTCTSIPLPQALMELTIYRQEKAMLLNKSNVLLRRWNEKPLFREYCWLNWEYFDIKSAWYMGKIDVYAGRTR